MRIVLLMLFTLFLTACHKKNPSMQESELKIMFLNEVNSLDPRYGYEIPANFAVKTLFEGLMRVNTEGQIVPAIASHYEVSKDQKSYTFHLRPSLWSNGEKLTAYDFEYAWKGVIDPSLPTQGKADFYPIKNVENVIAGKSSLDEVGIHALDANTLHVELENPTPYFLELITTSAYLPVNRSHDEAFPHWAEKGGEEFVCNGPFHLAQWDKNYSMIFEKNPFYWDEKNVPTKKITVAIVEDATTQMLLFEKGESDFFGKPLTKLPLDSVEALKAKHCLHERPEQAVYWYFLNTEKFPLNNPKIRLALALSIHREDITKHILKESEEPALAIYRNHVAYFQDADISTAQKLFQEGLEELGLTLSTFPELPLSYCGIETNHRIANAVQQQWQEALKIRVKLDPQEWTTYYDRLSSGELLIGGLSWHSRVKDPIYNLQIFKYRNDRLNMSYWEDSYYQQLLTSAQEELNFEKRDSLLSTAESYLISQMPVIPIYFLTLSYAKKDNLENVYLSETNTLDLSRAYLR